MSEPVLNNVGDFLEEGVVVLGFSTPFLGGGVEGPFCCLRVTVILCKIPFEDSLYQSVAGAYFADECVTLILLLNDDRPFG